MPRIRAHHDPAFDTGRSRRGACKLTVRFTDGTVAEESVAVPRTYGCPLDRTEVIAKFETLTADLVTLERRQRIVETTLGLDKLDSADAWVQHLTGSTKPVFR